MKIKIVHTLSADWLYGVCNNTPRVSVLCMYMTSRYILITLLIFDNKYSN